MSGLSQLGMYENHPLYRDMLKTILMSQIQILLDQLSSHTGEETVILTASIEDAKITDIGTECGRAFLKGHNDIKTNFLGFCLKRHYERQADESDTVLGHNNSIYENSKTIKEIKSHLHSTKAALNIPKKPSHAKKQQDWGDTAMQEWEKAPTNHDPSRDPRAQDGYPVAKSAQEEYSTTHVNLERREEEEEDFTDMMVPVVDEAKDMRSGSKDANNAKDGILRKRDENSLLSWRDDTNPTLSLQDQISSKRKQKAPKRMKVDSLDVDTTSGLTDLTVDSDPELDHDKSVRKPTGSNFMWTVDELNINNVDASPVRTHEADIGYVAESFGLGTSLGHNIDTHAKEQALWRYDSSKYEIPFKSKTYGGIYSSEDVPSLSRSPDMNGMSSYKTNSYHSDEPDRTPGSSPRAVDGVLVTRGMGRFEKLLKCEQCGKICRTSNMARHKKRYCLGCPKVKSVLQY